MIKYVGEEFEKFPFNRKQGPVGLANQEQENSDQL
jgi:hypothetical protein